MGSGSYSARDWDTYARSRKLHDPKTTTADIYASREIDPALDPKKFKVRESVDGVDNPESTPIILGLDVTGSMEPVLDMVARHGLKTLAEEVYNRKPVTNPHLCVLGIGDVTCDRAPFQATQFEADIRIAEQVAKLWLEKGGGGNNCESYILAWYFAAFRTRTDSFAKRGRKGFIFTIGDEDCPDFIEAKAFKEFLGETQARAYTAQELLTLVEPAWNLYHVILKQGNNAMRRYPEVRASWDAVIGSQRVVALDDFTKLGETIVALLEVNAGRELRNVTATWDHSTAVIVGDALKGVTSSAGAAVKPLDSVL